MISSKSDDKFSEKIDDKDEMDNITEGDDEARCSIMMRRTLNRFDSVVSNCFALDDANEPCGDGSEAMLHQNTSSQPCDDSFN